MASGHALSKVDEDADAVFSPFSCAFVSKLDFVTSPECAEALGFVLVHLLVVFVCIISLGDGQQPNWLLTLLTHDLQHVAPKRAAARGSNMSPPAPTDHWFARSIRVPVHCCPRGNRRCGRAACAEHPLWANKRDWRQ